MPTYDPNKPPWQQDYAAPGVVPQTAPAAPATNPQVPPWQQNYNAPAVAVTPSAASPGQPASTDPFIQDLQQNWPAQLAAGVTQGFLLDPIEKAGELTGIGQNPPKWLEDRLQATREAAGSGYAGVGGHIAGQVANPLYWLLPELKAPEVLGKAGQAAAKLLTGGYRGAVGGATQPTGAKTPGDAAKATIPQAETGALVGGLLAAPGALARSMGFKNVQQPLRTIVRSLPLEFRRLEHLRDLGIPNFTTWWHGHSLEPIGGRAPVEASKEAMDRVGGQIGAAIDKATRNMTFDVTDPTVSRNLATTLGTSRLNLATSGGALNEYNRIVNDLVTQPLSYTGGRLNSDELQQITSNLDAHIRQIQPSTPDNALLKRELENYRMTILDNASGTRSEKAAYAKAREAWRRHATGRDSQPLGESSGFIDPDHVARELSRRDPLRYPYGGGPRGRQDATQRAVNQAQQAIIRMSSAAQRGKRGLPLRQPEDLAAPAGAVSQDQPMRFTWPSQ